jgi:hypothetical protein
MTRHTSRSRTASCDETLPSANIENPSAGLRKGCMSRFIESEPLVRVESRPNAAQPAAPGAVSPRL